MKRRGWEASEAAEKEFNAWYKQCIGIGDVMKGYDNFLVLAIAMSGGEDSQQQADVNKQEDHAGHFEIVQMIDSGQYNEAEANIEKYPIKFISEWEN